MAQGVTLMVPATSAGADGIIRDQKLSASNPLPVSSTAASATAGAVTNVNDTATSTTLLAANTARKGAIITNTSSAILYVRLASGTASATMFTYRLPQNATQEVGLPYTGIITGVWATDPNDGVAVVTELV